MAVMDNREDYTTKRRAQDERDVMLEIVDCGRGYPKIEDEEISYEDITEDEEAKDQHLDEVLASFEVELRLLEKWL